MQTIPDIIIEKEKLYYQYFLHLKDLEEQTKERLYILKEVKHIGELLAENNDLFLIELKKLDPELRKQLHYKGMKHGNEK